VPITPVVCNEFMFLCKSENLCITKYWVCDGDYHCSDHSDEEEEMCAEIIKNKPQCSKNEFDCILPLPGNSL